jgi:cell division protein ZapA (FtsZ GTPase activity inhibitor)
MVRNSLMSTVVMETTYAHRGDNAIERDRVTIKYRKMELGISFPTTRSIQMSQSPPPEMDENDKVVLDELKEIKDEFHARIRELGNEFDMILTTFQTIIHPSHLSQTVQKATIVVWDQYQELKKKRTELEQRQAALDQFLNFVTHMVRQAEE